jgi:C4-dicarboxylate transporter/malic acid transport protein
LFFRPARATLPTMSNVSEAERLSPVASPRTGGRRFMRALEHPADAFRHIGPNWFASVMGTGIVANAAILLPRQTPALHDFALAVWILAVALLAVVSTATLVHWVRHLDRARAHASDPAMAPFFGAPPMALMTVGAGTLLIGGDLIGSQAAVLVDSVLWSVGTLGGLLVSVAIPVLMFTRHDLDPSRTFATWLMPVVPPMVSAATGAALIPHLDSESMRLAMLLGCYAMFGLSLLISLVTITLVWFRLAYHKVGPAQMVPTLWIVLGPLGQSITAAGLLGARAEGVIAAPYATAMEAMGVLYGMPIWGFAICWLAIVAVITVRAARRHLPFSLTWWSFTFPVGTVVTGTSLLATQTGSGGLAWIAVGLYAFLVLAWLTAFANTARSAWSGTLFVPPAPAPVAAPSSALPTPA